MMGFLFELAGTFGAIVSIGLVALFALILVDNLVLKPIRAAKRRNETSL